jgi:hypothetical protein
LRDGGLVTVSGLAGGMTRTRIARSTSSTSAGAGDDVIGQRPLG